MATGKKTGANFSVQASFLTAARDPAKARVPPLPQIALMGRSNVGKSTLLNRLGNNRKLARISATPGRTTEFNFFELRLRGGAGGRSVGKHLLLVDLPGFGYAKFSKGQREETSASLVNYIRDGELLRAVLLLNDCRRDPEEDELAVRDVAFNNDRRLLVILTKADKLTRAQLERRTKEIAASYGLGGDDIIPSGEGIPVGRIWERLLMLL